jgi:hypothetical protein
MEFKLSLRKKIYDKLFYEIHLNDNLYNRNKLLKFIQEKHRDDNEEKKYLVYFERNINFYRNS